MRRTLILAGLFSVLPMLGAKALDEVVVRSVGITDEKEREALDSRLRNASQVAGVLDEEEEESVEVPLTAQDILGLAQSDYARMISVLYSAGYFGPGVSIRVDGREAADIDPFTPPTQINRVEISVQTGDRFRFGKTDIEPRAPNAPPGPLVEGFQTGEVANSDLVGSAANAAVTEWREEGHAKADVSDQIIIADHDNRRLDVELDLSPGPKLKFGDVALAGRTSVREERVRQILGFPSGQVYSPEELRDSVNRVRRTGAFSIVTMKEEETPNADGTLDYTLTLVDEKPRRFGFSGEYATLDGITVAGFWLHRNLFGGAERLRIDGEVSNIGGQEVGFSDRGGVDYEANIRLTRPSSYGPDNDLFVFGKAKRTDDPEYFEDEVTIGAGFSRYFDETLSAEAALGLRYSLAENEFGTTDFFHVILPASVEWDKRDDPGDAKQGFYLDGIFMPYIGIQDSKSGLRIEADGRAYYGFGESKNVVLASRLQIGSVIGSGLLDTPPDFLFFSGGGDTVRGQAYQSLGYEFPDGRVTGGRSFLGMQNEIRTSFSGSLGLVGFFDFGIVGPDSFIGDGAELQSGVGIGARYATPIGPLRVDFATPVAGDREAFSSVELYIGVGQAF